MNKNGLINFSTLSLNFSVLKLYVKFYLELPLLALKCVLSKEEIIYYRFSNKNMKNMFNNYTLYVLSYNYSLVIIK